MKRILLIVLPMLLVQMASIAGPDSPNLPADILSFKEDASVQLPQPEFLMGETVLTVHISGLAEGSQPETLVAYSHNIFAQRVDKLQAVNKGGGVYVFQFPQFCTGMLSVNAAGRTFYALLYPGERAELFYDASAGDGALCGGFRSKYSQVNSQLMKYGGLNPYYDMELISQNGDILDKTPAQNFQYRKERYDRLKEGIESSGLSTAMKQLAMINLKGELALSVVSMHMFYNMAYAGKHGGSLDGIVPVVAGRDEFEALKREVDLSDPMMVYSDDYYLLGGPLSAMDYGIDDPVALLTGSSDGLLGSICKTTTVIRKAYAQEPLTAQETGLLDRFPYNARIYEFIATDVKAKVQASLAKGGFEIAVTPDVPDDALIAAIVAKHKGSTVFVDFWATWCGPCLKAMDMIKPIKPQIREKGVVFIYITGPSSPKATWSQMLSEIGSTHYYLSAGQWEYICKEYDIPGIPAYMIFDKDGKKVFQTIGYPGNDKMLEELSKVW